MRLLSMILGICLALGVSGCAGYRLGPTNGVEAGAHTIEIQAFKNKTIEPRLSDAVTSAVRREIQRDGTYRLKTDGSSDIVVTGEILRYRRSEVSFQPEDIRTVRDYNITLWARVTAKDRLTDRVLLQKDVNGWAIIRVGDDLQSSERQALPVLADDLAKNIASALVDGTW